MPASPSSTATTSSGSATSTAAWFACATSTATTVFVRRLGFGAGGCPPGLAKKPVACMPPGQAAKLVGQPLVAANRFGALAPVPLALRNFYYRR